MLGKEEQKRMSYHKDKNDNFDVEWNYISNFPGHTYERRVKGE